MDITTNIGASYSASLPACNITPATGQELDDIVFRENKQAFQELLNTGRITKDTLAWNNPRTNLSMLHYFAKYAKNSIEDEIIAAIKLASPDQLNMADADGVTPLVMLVKKNPGSLNVFKAMVEAGADINAADSDGTTILMHLMRSTSCVDFLQYMCSQGIDLDKQDKNGDTALHIAIEETNCGYVDILHAARASSNIKNNNNKTAQDLAVGKGYGFIFLLNIDPDAILYRLEDWYGESFREDIMKTYNYSLAMIDATNEFV